MMSCPTCDHTMQMIYSQFGGQRSYWCPRCGTIWRGTDDDNCSIDKPTLLDRIVTLIEQFSNDHEFMTAARKLGIVEAIWPPEQRHVDWAEGIEA